jgi:hypothetical protein
MQPFAAYTNLKTVVVKPKTTVSVTVTISTYDGGKHAGDGHMQREMQ